MLNIIINENILKIEGDVVITNLKELQKSLKEVIDENNICGLDLTGVKLIDTAGVQLIIVFLRSFIKQHEISITGISETVLKILEITGLKKEFEDYLNTN